MMKLSLLLVSCLACTAFAYPSEKEDYNSENDIYEFERYVVPLTSEQQEAEMMVSALPFRMPVALNKYQKVAIVKLGKQFLKPILMSEALKTYARQLEDVMMALRNDPDLVDYIKEMVNGAQNILERTDSKMIEGFVTWLVAQYTDEQTARSVSTFWTGMNPTVKSWVTKPVYNYYYYYVKPALRVVRHNLEQIMGEDVSANVIARSSAYSWGDFVEPYLQRMAEMAVGMRGMVDATSEFLREQEDARSL